MRKNLNEPPWILIDHYKSIKHRFESLKIHQIHSKIVKKNALLTIINPKEFSTNHSKLIYASHTHHPKPSKSLTNCIKSHGEATATTSALRA